MTPTRGGSRRRMVINDGAMAGSPAAAVAASVARVRRAAAGPTNRNRRHAKPRSIRRSRRPLPPTPSRPETASPFGTSSGTGIATMSIPRIAPGASPASWRSAPADAPRVAQARAGGADRLSTDDGGHYIAARFNGPKEAFNHFAQDRSVNRGRYRRFEEQWARAKRAGHRVSVKIVPNYERSSRRPRMINVWFSIDGNRQSDQFPNSATGGKHAK